MKTDPRQSTRRACGAPLPENSRRAPSCKTERSKFGQRPGAWPILLADGAESGSDNLPAISRDIGRRARGPRPRKPSPTCDQGCCGQVGQAPTKLLQLQGPAAAPVGCATDTRRTKKAKSQVFPSGDGKTTARCRLAPWTWLHTQSAHALPAHVCSRGARLRRCRLDSNCADLMPAWRGARAALAHRWAPLRAEREASVKGRAKSSLRAGKAPDQHAKVQLASVSK